MLLYTIPILIPVMIAPEVCLRQQTETGNLATMWAACDTPVHVFFFIFFFWFSFFFADLGDPGELAAQSGFNTCPHYHVDRYNSHDKLSNN